MSEGFIVMGICTLGLAVWDLFLVVYLMRACKNRTKDNMMKLLNLMPFRHASSRKTSKEKLIREHPKGALIIVVVWVVALTIAVVFLSIGLPSVWNNY